MSDDFLKVSTVARELGVSKGAVYGLIKRGELRAKPINQRRDLRIYRPWLVDYIQSSPRPEVPHSEPQAIQDGAP